MTRRRTEDPLQGLPPVGRFGHVQDPGCWCNPDLLRVCTTCSPTVKTGRGPTAQVSFWIDDADEDCRDCNGRGVTPWHGALPEDRDWSVIVRHHPLGD